MPPSVMPDVPYSIELEAAAPSGSLLKDVIRTGKFVHPITKQAFEVTKERLDKWENNFKRMQEAGINVPIYDGHNSGKPLGSIGGALSSDGRLYMKHNFADPDAEKQARRHQFSSVRIEPEYTDSQGNKYEDAIVHVACTSEPVITKQQDYIQLSRNEDGFELNIVKHDEAFDGTTPRWGDVDKSELPSQAFLEVGDPELKSTWSFPVFWIRNGSDKNDKGVFQDGDLWLHPQGLSAALAASRGARGGKKNSDVEKKVLKLQEKIELSLNGEGQMLDDLRKLFDKPEATEGELLDLVKLSKKKSQGEVSLSIETAGELKELSEARIDGLVANGLVNKPCADALKLALCGNDEEPNAHCLSRAVSKSEKSIVGQVIDALSMNKDKVKTGEATGAQLPPGSISLSKATDDKDAEAIELEKKEKEDLKKRMLVTANRGEEPAAVTT